MVVRSSKAARLIMVQTIDILIMCIALFIIEVSKQTNATIGFLRSQPYWCKHG